MPSCGVSQPVEYIQHHAHDFADRHLFLAGAVVVEARFERVAFQQFHHHVVDVVLHIGVVDLHDVGVPQRRDDLRLALKTRQKFGVVHQFAAQHFNRHKPIELGMIRAVHARHAAMTQLLAQLIFS
jgi:hypothetical protein